MAISETERPVPDTERQVLERYAGAAQERESALCCPVQYDAKFLAAIPQEILGKDYGCGDPSRYVREGDVVLDLGSGGGKICYIASQAVGPKGRVIGVDFNPAMLALAGKHQAEAVANIGWDNVTFLYGKIQDLRTDYGAIGRRPADAPGRNAGEYPDLEGFRRGHTAPPPRAARPPAPSLAPASLDRESQAGRNAVSSALNRRVQPYPSPVTGEGWQRTALAG